MEMYNEYSVNFSHPVVWYIVELLYIMVINGSSSFTL